METSMPDARTEAERLKAKALARWEGEGGALSASQAQPHSLDQTEMAILSRLGAALLEEWNKLPIKVQRAIFARVSTLRVATDGLRIKAEIARFLLASKDH
jgi:hypothetical protein